MLLFVLLWVWMGNVRSPGLCGRMKRRICETDMCVWLCSESIFDECVRGAGSVILVPFQIILS